MLLQNHSWFQKDIISIGTGICAVISLTSLLKLMQGDLVFKERHLRPKYVVELE